MIKVWSHLSSDAAVSAREGDEVRLAMNDAMAQFFYCGAQRMRH